MGQWGVCSLPASVVWVGFRPGVICELKFVVGFCLVPRVFLRVIWFSSFTISSSIS